MEKQKVIRLEKMDEDQPSRFAPSTKIMAGISYKKRLVFTILMMLFVSVIAQTITVGNDGTDHVENQNYCQFVDFLEFAGAACDYDNASIGYTLNPDDQYTDVYDRTLFVGWTSPNLIRSIRVQAEPFNNNCKVDLYVTTSKPFPLNDTRTICQLNVNAEGDGIWNCPSVLKGTYLALMTKPGCDIKRWKIAEIRAWSRKDISNSATLLVSGTAPVPNWLIGPATLFDYYSEGSFPYVVDLGSLLELQTVYISFHAMKNLDLVYISTGITEPETSQTPPSLENSASYTQSNNNEEWYFNQTPTSVRYILIYNVGFSVSLRKIAAFGFDYCSPATSITTSLVSAYSWIVYTPSSSILIPWPDYTVTPDNCFIPVDFVFKDSQGNLLAPGIVTVDWIEKRINYQSQNCPDPYITIQAEFNTLNAALGSIDVIPFTCSCSTTTILSQTFASTEPYQISFNVTTPVSIVSFLMN